MLIRNTSKSVAECHSSLRNLDCRRLQPHKLLSASGMQTVQRAPNIFMWRTPTSQIHSKNEIPGYENNDWIVCNIPVKKWNLFSASYKLSVTFSAVSLKLPVCNWCWSGFWSISVSPSALSSSLQTSSVVQPRTPEHAQVCGSRTVELSEAAQA